MKKKSLLVFIGVLLILAACSNEKTVQDKEKQSEVDSIEPTYKNGDIFISSENQRVAARFSMN